MPEKQTQWTRAWNEKHLDRLSITVPKGRREDISNHAAEHGESVNQMVNRLICEDMNIDPAEWKNVKNGTDKQE